MNADFTWRNGISIIHYNYYHLAYERHDSIIYHKYIYDTRKKKTMGDFQDEWHQQDNKDLVLGFISAMAHCNFEQLSAVLSSDVVWTIPGDSLVSGPARGLRAVLRRCQMIHDYNVRLDFQHMLYSMDIDTVAAVLRNTGTRRTGYQNKAVLKFDEDVTQVYRIGEDGKIRSITNFVSDVNNLNEYFQ